MKTSVWHRLYNGETNVTFISRWRIWFTLSGIVIGIGLISLLGRGLNLGIEFEGGVAWQVPVGESSVDSMRDAVDGLGLDATVQTVGTGSGERLRIRAELNGQDPDEVSATIADEAGVKVEDVTQQTVSKSWGDQITKKAQRALIIFLILVSLYIAFRFEWKMAAATLLALLHDIFVTVGIYSIFSFEVTPATVIAILTILGYSIYDGIVVFDRIDENAKALAVTGGQTYSDMVNDSMNQVLMRTLNTSITALLPITSLLVLGSFILGATTLEEFALALFIGLASGAYSSIFIASPALALLKEREEKWTTVRNRLERTGGGGKAAAAPAPAPVGGPNEELDAEDAAPEARQPNRPAPPVSRPMLPGSISPIQPRGRKKGRRR